MKTTETIETPASNKHLFLVALKNALVQARDVLVTADKVRALCALTSAEFDAAAVALSREAKVVLHYHDLPSALPPQLLQACVVVPRTGGGSVHYHAVGMTSSERNRWGI